MIHRATIERDGATGSDSWGNPNESSWSTHLSDLPCRVWYGSGSGGSAEREIFDGNKIVTTEDRTLIVPLGTDVTELDRVASIEDRAGSEIFAGPSKIESLGRRSDHLVIRLAEVK